MAITLTPDTIKRLRGSIKRFAIEHLDEEMGDLKASLLLDFVLKEIGPSIYNTAIADAQTYFQGRVADLEGVCHEKEFTSLDSRLAETREVVDNPALMKSRTYTATLVRDGSMCIVPVPFDPSTCSAR